MSQGSPVLIDVFVGEMGIYVILSTAVVLVGRDGAQLARIDAPREITAAAFDGTLLAVTDRALFSSYDLSLNPIGGGELAESCASAVLVSGSRLVCGPSNDWDRVFYTYDARSGSLLASSDKYTYNGIPMGRVPGTDDFVTVSGGSPSDFHLYSVAEKGAAVFINESPYHGDFRVTTTYGFDGSPPVHLVTDSGLLLRINADTCNEEQGPFSSQCFVKDGSLGTLSGSQVFLGMDSTAEGKLYGIVDPSPGSFSDPQCENGCLVQRIDIASRTVESQSLAHLMMGEVVRLRYDAFSSSVVVGYRLPGDVYFSGDPYPGHRVARLPLQ